MTCVMNEVSAYQKGRRVMQKPEIFPVDDGKIHLWGLSDGTTIEIKQVGRSFVKWEPHNEPIGIVARKLKLV